MSLLPEGLHAVKRVATTGGCDRGSASLHLDSGFDAPPTRQGIFTAGMLPTIPENPRHRQRITRGRNRLCKAALQAVRTRVDRTVAWADTCKRLLLRVACIQQRHFGRKLLAYTVINVREFCGA